LSILAGVFEDAKMEERDKTKPSHKEWRRVAKKERRRRIRRKAAQERDVNEEKLMAALMCNMEYLNWRAEQERLEEEKEIREQEEHAEQNKLWLEEEVNSNRVSYNYIFFHQYIVTSH